MNTLTLYCNSKNDTFDNLTGQSETGNWCVSPDRLEENIGSTVLLYESGGKPAYRGGTITGYEEVKGNYPSRRFKIFFNEDKSLVGDTRTTFARKRGVSNPVIWV